MSCRFRSADAGIMVTCTRVKLEDHGSAKDGAHHRVGDGHHCQLEDDGTGMTHDAGPDLDRLGLQADRRQIGHIFGQLDAAQEGG